MFLDFTLDYKTVFAVVAMLISTGSFINYVKSILQLRTKPHVYTWLIWSITMGTAVAALWHGHGGWGALALTLSFSYIVSIFFLSLKYGSTNITITDTIVLVLALLAIFVWWQLENILLAILMVTVIDLIGYIPSWRKSIIDPWSEAIASWGVSAVGTLCTIVALTEYNLLTVLYPLSYTVANIILVIICLVYRRGIPRPIQ